MRKDIRTLTKFPATHPIIRRELARDDICPECGGDLDTGRYVRDAVPNEN